MPIVTKPLGMRRRLVFFGGVFTVLTILIVGTFYLYEIVPGNSEEECRNQCVGSKNSEACAAFCDCIYKAGQPLADCLKSFNQAKAIPDSEVR